MVNYTAELQAQPYHSDDGYSTTSDSSGTLERSSLTDSSSRSNGQAMNSHPMKTDLPRPRSRTFFFLDNGVIFSLYWTALKSRDGLLRRRAIALLESSAQEGTWIGPIQAAITKRVVEIEEMQPYEQDPPPEMIKKPEDIPEFIRVHSVGTDIDKTRRRAKMVILQRLNGLDGEWDERVEWVHW
ncbi:hypothetical protein K469DRAFT_701053 [Zopfia rhizophila CBS 207.26]|uniref:Uncharacterized protein n=1 Tax=Zopfia rhizophila CBS 207.26 TaxID=1314779 RepID=A0A6A6EGK9_9PEZI|nr:hypothetical protein K469DRAFT_701053 [Zopfia rhizophila CBS 207.26]